MKSHSPLLDKIDAMWVWGKLLKYWSCEEQALVEIGTSVISKNLQFCKDLEMANSQLFRIVVGDTDWNMFNYVGNIHKLLVDHLSMLYIPCLLRCVKWFRKYFQSTSKTFGKYFWPVLWLYGVWLGCSLKCVKWFRKWGRKQIDRKRRRGFDQRSTDSYYFLMIKHDEIYIVNPLSLLTFLFSNCSYLLWLYVLYICA